MNMEQEQPAKLKLSDIKYMWNIKYSLAKESYWIDYIQIIKNKKNKQ